MAEARHVVGLVGLFEGPRALVEAATRVRDAGWSRWDCHTPFPVHGLDRAMGLRTSPLARYALMAGALGAVAAFAMQWWMSVVDYPVRIGGKPLFSWPSFVPITFEAFVLFSALATTLLATRMCGLWRWHSPLHDSGVTGAVVSDRFGVVLMASDPCWNEAAARSLLGGAGCTDIRMLYEDEDDGRTL